MGAAMLVVIAVLGAGTAIAQETIQAQDVRATIDFPEVITFHLTATSPSPIVKAELRYQVPHLSCGSVTATTQPQFAAGTRVDLDWEWNLLERGGLPIGATVVYEWVIEDASGRVITTPQTTLVFDDPRFSWTTLEGTHIVLHWYSGDEAFAQELLAAAEEGIDRLHASTGVLPSTEVQVYVYGSAASMREALAFAQEWTGGVSFSEYGLVAIGVEPSQLAWGKRAMVHEMTHVVMTEATFTCGSDLPTWLHEGLAVMNEGPLQAHYKSALDRAIEEDRVFSLRSLTGDFPYAVDEAVLAYAQSGSLVSYLAGLRGPEGLTELFAAFREAALLDEAMEQVFGFDQRGLERAWRASVELPVGEPQPQLTPRIRPLPTVEPYSQAPPPASPEPDPTATVAPTLTPTPTATPDAARTGGPGCNRAASGGPTDVGGGAAVAALGLLAVRRRRSPEEC